MIPTMTFWLGEVRSNSLMALWPKPSRWSLISMLYNSFLKPRRPWNKKSLPRWPHKHNLGKNPSHLRSPLYEISNMCMSSAYLSFSTCTYHVLLVHVYNRICIYAAYMYISTLIARQNHFYTIRLQTPAMYGQNSNTLLGYSPQIFHVYPLIIL